MTIWNADMVHVFFLFPLFSFPFVFPFLLYGRLDTKLCTIQRQMIWGG